MSLKFLVGMLTSETEVTVKGYTTGNTLWTGAAADARKYEDVVVDWDFSQGHIIYIAES